MSYLLAYALVVCTLVVIREYRQTATIERFLVADRSIGGIIGAMSIAASWIWAPAIFVSTRVGYEWGFSGVVWFVVPNMLALLLFAPIAAVVRKRLPMGYSYIESLHDRTGYFRQTQLSVQLLLQVLIFAIQLTAGAELLAVVTGSSYYWLIFGMAVTPVAYAIFSGLRTSTFTDAIQYAAILIAAAWIFGAFPGLGALVSEYQKGNALFDARPFEPFNTTLLWQFGISSGLGLIVAIFADHQQWQRAFSAKKENVVGSFWLAALLHGLVTTLLATFGCLIAKSNYHAASALELVGIDFIRANYPAFCVTIFVVVALCALISTLDSGLCAFSSLMLTQVLQTPKNNKVALLRGRQCMLALALFGLLIGLVRPSLLTLWFLAGTIRLATFAPTLVSILHQRFSGMVGTIAIVTGFAVGLSIFGYGIWMNDMTIRTIGMIASISTSTTIVLVWTAAEAGYYNKIRYLLASGALDPHHV